MQRWHWLVPLLMWLTTSASAGGQVPTLLPEERTDAQQIARLYSEAGWARDAAVTSQARARDSRLDFLGAIGNRPIANMQSDGGLLRGAQITAAGMPPYIVRARDTVDGVDIPVVRVELNPTARRTARSWRSQIADPQIEPYRRYAWVLSFKLDSSWDTSLQGQSGLIWQLLGRHRPGQHGNPVIAFNLDRNEFYCSILYPKAAAYQPRGAAVRWGQGEYLPVRLPRRTLTPGRYHTLQIDMFADDRMAAQGGRGYLNVLLDGDPWIDYTGPTLQPDQTGPHLPLWGWYQWEARPTQARVIWWAVNQMYLDADALQGR